MKKFLFVLMAVCLTFAMIGCDKDPPDPGTPKVTITYNSNAGGDTNAPTRASVTINKGGSLSEDDLDVLADFTSTLGLEYAFDDWYDAAEDGSAITDETTFDVDTVIYAQWDISVPTNRAFIKFDDRGTIIKQVLIPTGAIGAANMPTPAPTRAGWTFDGWFLSDAQYNALSPSITASGQTITLVAKWTQNVVTVTFDYGYKADPSDSENIILEIETFELERIPAAKWPRVDRPTYTLDGWYTQASGGTKVESDATFDADTDLFAQWTATPAADANFLDGAIRFYSENNAYLLFKFELPSTKQWSNYTSITVDFAVEDSEMTKGCRSVRLYGNYKETDFENPVTGIDGALDTDYKWINLNTHNAAWIADDKGGGVSGRCPRSNEWFKTTFDFANRSPNGDFNEEANWPVAADTGPFYFGVALAGNDSSKNTDLSRGVVQWIRKVTLVGDASTDDIVSTGAGFVDSNSDPIPGFLGYGYGKEPQYSWWGEALDPVEYRLKPAAPIPDREPRAKPAAGNYEITDRFFINTGNPTNQRGWQVVLDPTDDGETADLIAAFAWAKYLAITVTDQPTGGGTFVCIYDEEDWAEDTQVFAGAGGNLQNGATKKDAGDGVGEGVEIWIELEKALDFYYKAFHTASDKAGFALGYWGASGHNLESMGITATAKVWLVVED